MKNINDQYFKHDYSPSLDFQKMTQEGRNSLPEKKDTQRRAENWKG